MKMVKKIVAIAALATMALSFGSAAGAQAKDIYSENGTKLVAKDNRVILFSRDPGGV
jgi:hypothetical protein